MTYFPLQMNAGKFREMLRDYNQPVIVLRIISIAWICSKLICFRLWGANRLFPLVPVHDSLSNIPPFVHGFLFGLSLLLMFLFLFFPGRKMAAFIILPELFSCCLDQNRWQPWEYFFLFMLLAYVFTKREKELPGTWLLIMAGLYFFGGIGKMNTAFIHDTWKYLMLHRWLDISTNNIWVTRSGYLLPLLEMLAGLGLLVKQSRKISILILIGMHLVILLMLGPAGLNINHVVWPWNTALAILLLLIFYSAQQISFTIPADKPFVWVVLLCWWILPWFRFTGHWDRYLSSVLYSGGVEQLFICTESKAAVGDMGSYMDPSFSVIPCSPVLSVYNWGIKEMRTAPYPEPRIRNAIIKAWKEKYPGSNHRFYIYKPGFAYTVKELKLPE